MFDLKTNDGDVATGLMQRSRNAIRIVILNDLGTLRRGYEVRSGREGIDIICEVTTLFVDVAEVLNPVEIGSNY